MPKYHQIVDGPWADATLFAESIPHLLHWDLAYLWVLEKARDHDDLQIPELWQRRIDAWGHLVGLFLTGGVNIENEPISRPLLDFTSPYGVSEVQWLVAHGQRIGVVSPTALVRPLPDFTLGDEALWPDDARMVAPREVRHFAQKLVQRLNEAQGTYAPRLADIVQSRFKPDPLYPPPAGRAVPVPVLVDLRWTQATGDGAFRTLDLFVSEDVREGSTFIPRCPTCQGQLLIENGTAVDIQGDADVAFVPCAGCQGETCPVRLDRLLVWNWPGRREAIVWQASGQVGPPAHGKPPLPLVEGDTVRFAWNPAQATDEQRRELAFRFAGKTVRGPLPIGDAFYDKLLVPGDPAAFSGAPIRAEWRDALVPDPEGTASPMSEGQGTALRVTYSGLRLAGWPDPITWVYSGESRIQHAPALHVGVFPDPDRMPPGWRWFRTFAVDTATEGHENRATLDADGQALFPWTTETEDGPPASLALVLGEAGVSYAPAWATRTAVGASSHYVGLDFGTTNTIAYAMTEGERRQRAPTPSEHGLQPSSFADATRWLTGSAPSADVFGGFLPGPAYEGSGTDPYVTPTALWTDAGASVIRWGADPPTANAEPSTNFKLDRGLASHTHAGLRRRFLREYLLLMLPSVLDGSPAEQPTVNLGLAFPLALTFSERADLAALFSEVAREVGSLTSATISTYTIDEAQACVEAFGSANPGESFLIADMGGGTLDFALFTTGTGSSITYHQIGSVEFAGEAFVESVASQTPASTWDLRDAIRSDTGRLRYGGNGDISRLRSRFYAYAFEFIRTMVAAFREEAPRQPLRVVLVGNGWHLVEAFDTGVEREGRDAVFQNHYQAYSRAVGVEGLSLYGIDEAGEVLAGLPSTKHLVVIGALQNAASGTPRHALTGEAQLSRLPAGRAIEVGLKGKAKRIAWCDLVGLGSSLEEVFYEDIQGRVDIDLASAPEAHPSWRSLLERTFGVDSPHALPAPRVETLRQRLQQFATVGSSQTAVLERGPLQLILEEAWLDSLRNP